LEAYAINDSGQIVGSGIINGRSHAFLLNLTSTPTITWSASNAITYPASLSAPQLDATANVPGTFVYTPPAGTVLRAGDGQTLSVTFTPTNPEFTTATVTTTINVNQGTPIVTWPAPAAITFGGRSAPANWTPRPTCLGVSFTTRLREWFYLLEMDRLFRLFSRLTIQLTT
jgi:hypothetical protein